VLVRRPQLFNRKGKADFTAKFEKATQLRGIVGANKPLSQGFIGAQSNDKLQSISHGHQGERV